MSILCVYATFIHEAPEILQKMSKSTPAGLQSPKEGSNAHARTHTHTHAHAHARARTHTHTHTHTHAHAHAHAHARARTHTHTHTHTHARDYTHTHSTSISPSRSRAVVSSQLYLGPRCRYTDLHPSAQISRYWRELEARAQRCRVIQHHPWARARGPSWAPPQPWTSCCSSQPAFTDSSAQYKSFNISVWRDMAFKLIIF